MENSKKLLIEVSKIGKAQCSKPLLFEIKPFKHFFDKKNQLLVEELGELDGRWTRREIITRFLLLSAVLDQGPDIGGVRLMLAQVVNELYKQEIRIFHRPLDFFKEIGVSVDNIINSHNFVKKIRSVLWATENQSTAEKYNLFMDNSKQVLNYAIFRCGVPLAVPLLLEKDGSSLITYLEQWQSGEIMSQQLKDHYRYGLGKAIGDKAAHLFAKWYIHSFNLVKNNQSSWGKLSFELPLDSNVGRILFRTGWLLNFANLNDLEDWQVIQKKQGKGGTHYIRVTNMRGKRSVYAREDLDFFNNYTTVCRDYLKTKINPRSVEIQQIPGTLLLNTDYGVGDLDDGLVYIGTNFCLNLEKPKCNRCPISNFCEGYKRNHKLIEDYRT